MPICRIFSFPIFRYLSYLVSLNFLDLWFGGNSWSHSLPVILLFLSCLLIVFPLCVSYTHMTSFIVISQFLDILFFFFSCLLFSFGGVYWDIFILRDFFLSYVQSTTTNNPIKDILFSVTVFFFLIYYLFYH